jgi:hypothetical protein
MEQIQRQRQNPDALDSDLDDDGDLLNGVVDDELDEYVIPRTSNQPELIDDSAPSSSSNNMLLCLYDKVHRVRNKWRCHLKNGILRVYGREFCLNKLSGDFDW